MSQKRRSFRSLGKAAALLLALLLAASPAAAGADGARQAGSGTVRIVVTYRDADGHRARLAGVEVFLLEVTPSTELTTAESTLSARHMGPIYHPGGTERYACTNANGVAVFKGVSAEADLWAVVGIGHPGVCSNAAFVNPSTGRKLLSVDSQGVYGGGEYVPFSIAPDEVKTIRMFARTPRQQNSVCGGFYVTLAGTPGDDVLVGTPGPDVIFGGDGKDQIRAEGGWDIVCGGRGNDIVYGGPQPDVIFGDGGRDILKGQRGVDWGFGGGGVDTCRDVELSEGCERIISP